MHLQSLLDFIEQLGLENITLVCQDWGGLLGLGTVGTTAHAPAQADPFGLTSAFTISTSQQQSPPRQNVNSAEKDMLGIFEKVSISDSSPAP